VNRDAHCRRPTAESCWFPFCECSGGDSEDGVSPEVSPSFPPSDQRRSHDGDSGDTRDSGVIPARTSWTAPELMSTVFPEPKWAVEGIVPEGASLLAGPPKVGKSWLGLGLAVSVASGGLALGRVPVTEGDALYLALEDPGRRVQQRLGKVLAGDRPPPRLTVTVACPPIASGGSDRICGWLDRNPGARLVIVDVLARVRSAPGQNIPRYDADYAAITELKTIADKYAIAVLVVHHTRKMTDADFLQEVSGTNGLAGAADSILVLRRSRGEADGVLHVTGRDVDEAEYALKFAADLGSWQLLEGPAIEHTIGETRSAILKYVRENEGSSPKQIASGAGLGYELVKKTVARMADDGQLDTDGNGHYLAPAAAGTKPAVPTVSAVPAAGQSTDEAVPDGVPAVPGDTHPGYLGGTAGKLDYSKLVPPCDHAYCNGPEVMDGRCLVGDEGDCPDGAA
jgi:AAA domain